MRPANNRLQLTAGSCIRSPQFVFLAAARRSWTWPLCGLSSWNERMMIEESIYSEKSNWRSFIERIIGRRKYRSRSSRRVLIWSQGRSSYYPRYVPVGVDSGRLGLRQSNGPNFNISWRRIPNPYWRQGLALQLWRREREPIHRMLELWKDTT